MATRWRARAAALLTIPALSLILAGCEDTPAPVTAAPVTAASAAPARPEPAATGGIVLAPQPDAEAAAGGRPGAMLPNDPSAPIDTPLCGAAAREVDQIGETLLPQQYADAGICRSFACYDPATATYIGLDGYRHICR